MLVEQAHAAVLVQRGEDEPGPHVPNHSARRPLAHPTRELGRRRHGQAREQAGAVERAQVGYERRARRQEGRAADRVEVELEEAAPFGEEVRAGEEAPPEAAHAARGDEGREREVAQHDEQNLGGEVGEVHRRRPGSYMARAGV